MRSKGACFHCLIVLLGWKAMRFSPSDDDESDGPLPSASLPPVHTPSAGPPSSNAGGLMLTGWRPFTMADTPSPSPGSLQSVTRPTWYRAPTAGRSLQGAFGVSQANPSEEAHLQAVEGLLHSTPLYGEGQEDSLGEPDFPCDSDGYEQELRSESDDDGEPSTAAAATTLQLRTVTPSSKALATLRAEHERAIDEGRLALWVCGCKKSKDHGWSSCLDHVSKVDLKALYNEAHGPAVGRWPKAKVLEEHHKKIYALRAPRPQGPDAHGHAFHVPTWRLGGRVVCSAAWIKAHNYTSNGHRINLAMTMGGVMPGQVEAKRLADKAVLSFRRMQSSKSEWATQWWVNHLRLHDWLPNECAIQVRGADWKLVFDSQYLPVAALVHMNCSRSTWMQARRPALRLLSREFYPDRDDRELKCKRAANHSRFPECNSCQTLKKIYLKVATDPNSPKDTVDGAYKDLLLHNESWSNDRQSALKLKYESTQERASSLYQGDDKCGSFWQSIPVSSTGRDSKAAAKANFSFSIQSNVVFGQGGLQRFAVTPKFVTTGGNFGLTNFVMALQSAKEKGRLGPHVTELVRHTDGGPDNVASVTQILHWLLIYLGCFQTLLWFRFEPGHSHTELSDRLFSLLKRLFAVDGKARPEGIGCFPELWAKLQEKLKE